MIRAPLVLGFVIAPAVIAACQAQPTSTPARQQTLADSADHVMYNARMLIAANGVRRGEVSGEVVLSLDAASRFDFRPLRAAFITPLGRPLASVSAPGGEYTLATAILKTRGDVVITSDTARRRIDAKAVVYDPARNQFTSDSTFTATAGTRKLTGVGFTADPGLFSIKCLQGCKGSLGP